MQLAGESQSARWQLAGVYSAIGSDMAGKFPGCTGLCHVANPAVVAKSLWERCKPDMYSELATSRHVAVGPDGADVIW